MATVGLVVMAAVGLMVMAAVGLTIMATVGMVTVRLIVTATVGLTVRNWWQQPCALSRPTKPVRRHFKIARNGRANCGHVRVWMVMKCTLYKQRTQ